MQSSSTRRTLSKLIVAIAALAVGVFVAHQDTIATHDFALTFTATTVTALCDSSAATAGSDAICIGDPEGAADKLVSAAADISTKLTIPSADSNFGAVVTNTPGQAYLAPGPGHPNFGSGFDPGAAEDGAAPGTCNDTIDNPGGDALIDAADPDCQYPALGEIVGSLQSASTVTFSNLACKNPFAVPIKFINATVDLSTQINPLPQASASAKGTLENMITDSGWAGGPNGTDDGAPEPGLGGDDIAGPTAVENGLPASVELFPGYLKAIFDPDFISYGADLIYGTADDNGGAAHPAPVVQPLARAAGNTIVNGSYVSLHLVFFAPNALSSAFTAPHPFSDTADLGVTAISVLQNPTAPAQASIITCFSAPLQVLTTSFGESRVNPCNGTAVGACDNTPGIYNPATGANTGKDRYRNPAAAGTYLFSGFHQSQRDADGDGIENAFDTCDFLANTLPAEDPKVNEGPDGDMLDSVCDPNDTPGPGTNQNEDGDVGGATDWYNTNDNCPLNANPDQLESEVDLSYYNTFATNPAPHGGGKTDAIGDVCDPDDTKAAGDFITTLSITAKCIGGTDVDLDGWCASGGAGVLADDGGASPASPCDSGAGCAAKTPEDYDILSVGALAQSGPGWTEFYAEAGADCADSADDDDDGYVNDGCPKAGDATPVTSWVEAGTACENAIDEADEDPTAGVDPDDTLVNDGCPTRTSGDPTQICNDGLDNDGDTLIDLRDSGAAGNSTCEPNNIQRGALAANCAVSGCGVIGEVTCTDSADGEVVAGTDGFVNDGCPTVGSAAETGAQCFNSINDDAADDGGTPRVNDGCPAAGSADNDGDGFTDEQERWIGTDSAGRCQVGTPIAGIPSNAWPIDLFPGSVDTIDLQDLLTFTANPRHFNTVPGDALYDVRWDLFPGGGIGLQDFNQVFASAAPEGAPPMFGGPRAFNSVACTNHPVFGN